MGYLSCVLCFVAQSSASKTDHVAIDGILLLPTPLGVGGGDHFFKKQQSYEVPRPY